MSPERQELKRIKELAAEAGFINPRVARSYGIHHEGNNTIFTYFTFDDGRESCYDVSRGKAHKTFVGLMKKEFGDRYRMTKHSDYYTGVWLRNS